MKNQEYELKIDSITSEGQGVGRVDGFAVFVPQTAAGDVVRVRIVKVKSGYAFGIVTEVIKPSPQRTEPACPHGAKCGGCQLMHIQYDAQLRIKQGIIRDALERIGGVKVDEIPVFGMDTPFRYRNKMIFPVGKDKAGQTVCGFYRERSHDIIPMTDCLLGDAVNAKILEAVLQYMQKNNVAPYDEISHTGIVRRVFTRCARATGEIMAVVSVNAKKLPNPDSLVECIRNASERVTSIILNINREKTNLVLGRKNQVLYGKETIDDQLCGLWFAISPHSFFQINPQQTEKLYETAIELATLTGDETVLDIYCGIGTISLLAAKSAKRVIGVEIVPQATADAKENAKRNGITNAEFYAADAQEIVPRLIKDGIRPDVVLLDPPRKGSDPDTLSAIVQSGAKRVVYVSCNPATLARDVRILCDAGYRLECAKGVDMFPWTHHIETVALLSRQINVHKMKLNSTPFEMIKSGEKTIELRLYDEKRQQIKIGDKIVFTNTTTGETLDTSVVKLHRCDSFKELYKSLPLLKCGYTTEDVDNANPSDMERYYSVEEQNKYGVVGIELCRPKQITDECCVLLCRI